MTTRSSSDSKLPETPRLLLQHLCLLEGLTKLHISFTDLTGVAEDVPAFHLDLNHHIHACDFCLLAKAAPRGQHFCSSNKYAVNRVVLRRGAGFSGYCHLGLLDIVEPLILQGKIMGIFYFGSVVVSGKEEFSREKILKFCQRNQTDPAPYLRELEKVPQIKEEMIPAYRDYLKGVVELAKYLCENVGIQSDRYQSGEISLTGRPFHEYPYLIKATVQFIRCHLSDPFTIKELSEHLKCHPDSLSRLFRQHVSIELRNFIKEERVNLAKRFLKNNKMSIAEVSDKCGFVDSRHFARVFKSFAGETPVEYRRKLPAGSKG